MGASTLFWSGAERKLAGSESDSDGSVPVNPESAVESPTKAQSESNGIDIRL